MNPRRRFARRREDRGDTLIEILVTIVVMGVTVTALIGALTLGVTSTDTHRHLTSVETVSRQYGELLVSNAGRPAQTTLSTAGAIGDGSLCVASSTGFPSTATGSFSAAVDGEVIAVTNTNNSPPASSGCTASLWTLSADLQADHPQSSTVTQYQSCPTKNDLFISFSPTDPQVTAPTVNSITNVEYFDRTGNAVTASQCATYWSNSGLPCSAFASNDTEHLTECDVPVIRVTVKLQSTDIGTSTGASATTQVTIRRGNT